MPTPVYTFSPGERIRSSEFNTNFQLLEQCLGLIGGTLTGTLNSQSVIPTATTYNLGSTALPFNDIFITGGVKMFDTDDSHVVSLVMGSNISANRTLTVATGDASRTLTLSGDPTLGDWFNQAVKTTSSPTFVSVTANVVGALIGNASTATTLATARAIYGNNFDGSAALTGIIASTYGGTGNGFTKFSGASSTEKTYTLPNASAAVLTDNAAVTLAQGGTNASLTASNGGILYSTASAAAILAGTATANKVLVSGSTAAPAWSAFTFPTSTTVNRILASSATNTVGEISTANRGVLVTDNSGVPSILDPGSTTTGALLQLGASSVTWSTAAFPTNATATGTYMRANGTNWVASTPTIPNTAGSAGQIWRSDGTNTAFTTATYPNTATVNQILYATSGNVWGGNANLTYNGTKLAIGSFGSNVLQIESSGVGSLGMIMYNDGSAGTTNDVVCEMRADTGAGGRGWFRGLSSGFATSGYDIADGWQLRAFNAGGLILVASDASGTIRMFPKGSTTARATFGNGLQMGAPTGGDEGTGTINVASDMYKNGTAYNNPAFVFEQHYTGEVVKFKSRQIAAKMEWYAGLQPLGDVEAFVQKNFDLPVMANNYDGGIFDRGDQLLAALEEAYLYLFAQDKRIAALEAQVARATE